MKTGFTNFEGKIALVTGASSGIGRALALNLATRGANLILNARNEAALQKLKNEIEAQGRKAHIIPLDLSEHNAAKTLHDKVEKLGLAVDLLINNAGYGRWGAFENFEMSDYERMIALNITTLTGLCYLFLPAMAARGGTGIINLGSTASFAPVPYSAVYGATKGYVLPFTEALRYEYAPKGVRIMALCPGATDTGFAMTALEKSEKHKARYEADGTGFKDRMQSPEDVVRECLDGFLADKQVVISGKENRNAYRLTKVLPRSFILNKVGGRFKKIAG